MVRGKLCISGMDIFYNIVKKTAADRMVIAKQLIYVK